MSRLNHDELPIVAHSEFGEKHCCGCLIVVERGDEADIVCNECGALVRTVPTDDVPQVLLRMGMEQGICSAICPHCQGLNTFLGSTSIEVFICKECGESVSMKRMIQ